jgi:hypothetical protein
MPDVPGLAEYGAKIATAEFIHIDALLILPT